MMEDNQKPTASFNRKGLGLTFGPLHARKKVSDKFSLAGEKRGLGCDLVPMFLVGVREIFSLGSDLVPGLVERV